MSELAGAGPDLLVGGTPRSGTTLVQRLANEIEGVRIPPESHFLRAFLPRLLGSHRLPLDATAVASAIAEYRSLGYLTFDISDAVRRVPEPCTSPIVVFRAILEAAAGDAVVIGDKTPSNLLWWDVAADLSPATRFVFVVRQPHAVIASLMDTPWRPAELRRAAVRWREEQRLVRRAASHLADRALVVRYEDVVEDPDGVRRLLASFLQLDAPVHVPETFSGPALSLDSEHWKHLAEGPIVNDRNDRWRSTLTSDQQRTVSAVCATEMVRFGYSPAGGHLAAGDVAQIAVWQLRRTVREVWRAAAGSLVGRNDAAATLGRVAWRAGVTWL